jgi:hypothetical protein
MGATAIAARIQLPRAASQRDHADACGLTFDQPGGPLVAVCGLTGGAGTSTLALALARQAAAESKAPVLVTESGGGRGSLAVLARHATPHPLADLARSIADDRVPADTFVELDAGLRLIAATPRRHEPAPPTALRALLGQARDAHGLVVVDCGTDGTADSPILASATHIIWTLPATAAGLGRARILLDSDVVPTPGRWREVLAATAAAPRPSVSVRALRRLAKQRCDRLVLIAHDHALPNGEPSGGESIMCALSGLAPALRSEP